MAESTVVDRVLDAAGVLFAERGIAAVNMADIAEAAGCSRATLYRYFDSRGTLLNAYVHREALAVGRRVARSIDPIGEPRGRLLAAMLAALSCVRENAALSTWFTRTSAGAEAAEASAVVHEMTAGFLMSIGTGDQNSVDRRSRWLVRVLTSLLTVPGRDDGEERALLEEFVLPLMDRP